jgi:hypothetical protein
MKKRLFGIISILAALAIVLAGCAVKTSPLTTSNQSSNGSGQLVVNITDAPSAPEIEQVWVTVEGVKIHLAADEITSTTTTTTATSTTTTTTTTTQAVENGWLSLALVGEKRFDLLTLQNGLQAKLAVGDLAAGTYTQLRMDVSKVEVKIKGDNELKEAKLPSGTLKFVHPFEIVAGQTTEITFDFDALKSINVQGNGQFMCKPVIKLNTIKQPVTNGNISITTAGLPNGEIGVLYNAVTFAVAGGTAPYTWSISAGTIPTNLVFDVVAGTLTGTPTVGGSYTFTVQVSDSSTPAKVATKEFTVEIAAAGALQIVTTTLPSGVAGTAYADAPLAAVGGTLPYIWSLAAGSSLPEGMTLTNGVIAGTPTAKGNYTFTVQVTDSTVPTANTDAQVISVQINKAS